MPETFTDTFFKHGCLGVLCRLAFVASLILIVLWLLWKLIAALWPILLALVLALVIFKLVRRQAKRKS